jgi:hypothetical protein
MPGAPHDAPDHLVVWPAADLRGYLFDKIFGPMSHLGSIRGREERTSKPPDRSSAPACVGPGMAAGRVRTVRQAPMVTLLLVVLTAPVGLFLVFGLMHVFLAPPRDRKALTILKLLPKTPTQIISLIVGLVRSMLQR